MPIGGLNLLFSTFSYVVVHNYFPPCLLLYFRIDNYCSLPLMPVFSFLFFRTSWSSIDMADAISQVRSGELGLREAARVYSLPTTTLKRRLDGGNKIATGSTKKDGRPTVLPDQLEEELAKHILTMEERLFGFTRQAVRKLAFQLAEKNNIHHDFNKTNGMAGKDWLKRFLKRHPEISVRDPQQTTIDRLKSFNRENVDKFFYLLEGLLDSHGFDATTVFNMDETGISTVQQSTTKILGKKGKRQIGCFSSAERGCTTTVVCCFSASGSMCLHCSFSRENDYHKR